MSLKRISAAILSIVFIHRAWWSKPDMPIAGSPFSALRSSTQVHGRSDSRDKIESEAPTYHFISGSSQLLRINANNASMRLMRQAI